MFQFRRFPSYAYFIQRRIPRYCRGGFPHSEICGSMAVCASPQLIAACHVLLRLLMPRHSPCALISLTSRRLSAFNHESCRLHKEFFAAHCLYPYQNDFRHSSLGFHNLLSFCPLLLASSLEIYIVQFSRCRPRRLSAASGLFLRPDRNVQLLERFHPSLKFLGGPKWTRTTDLAIISRAL